MQQITDYLADGVAIHSHSDSSGLVLFNDHSTQMLTVYMTIEELTVLCQKYFGRESGLAAETELTSDQLSLLKALQRQHFLQAH